VPARALAKGHLRRDKQPSDTRPICPMPTLMRLLTVLAVLAALVFAGLFALATLVEPKQSEMTIRIPANKINPPATDTGG
jgi:hypothetical protein